MKVGTLHFYSFFPDGSGRGRIWTDSKVFAKKFNNILQAINLLKDNELFCLKYNLYKDCTLCTIANEKIEYFVPYIEIKESDLNWQLI